MSAATSRQDIVDQLRALLGERLSTSLAIRENHGRDIAHPVAQPPDAVAFPLTTAEVVSIVKICHETGTPIVAFGVGTSLEGHVLAPRGGICLDFSRMNQVVTVNERDMDVTVQAGVTREDLNRHLRDSDLFFPIDPGANATLGGMSATRASGTRLVPGDTFHAKDACGRPGTASPNSACSFRLFAWRAAAIADTTRLITAQLPDLVPHDVLTPAPRGSLLFAGDRVHIVGRQWFVADRFEGPYRALSGMVPQSIGGIVNGKPRVALPYVFESRHYGFVVLADEQYQVQSVFQAVLREPAGR